MTSTEPTNLLAVIVKYVGPTDHRGSRVKMSLPRFNGSRTIPFDYSTDNAEGTAAQYFAENGLNPVARACGEDQKDILLFSTSDADALRSLLS